MRILLFNAGSSSLSFKLYEVPPGPLGTTAPQVLASGKAHRVGVTGTQVSFLELLFRGQTHHLDLPLTTHAEAAAAILDQLLPLAGQPQILGHRFVHGGRQFRGAALLDQANLARLRSCLPFAPLHNPASLAVIDHCLGRFPDLPQFVALDTAFHAGLPDSSAAYPSPVFGGYRKCGFHGLSYAFVQERVASWLGRPPAELNLVMAHLGTGGSSACVVQGGRSLDTTMGFTPLPGLIMSTRCGDLDPLLLPELARLADLALPQLELQLNSRSGVLGLSAGKSADLRDLQQLATSGDADAARVLRQSAARTASYLGAYLLLLPSCQALVFTDDLGARFAPLTDLICESLAFLGLRCAPSPRDLAPGLRALSTPESRIPVLAVDTDEELLILRAGLPLFERYQ
jgi:acetate kinase